jgi:hypothetical protein
MGETILNFQKNYEKIADNDRISSGYCVEKQGMRHRWEMERIGFSERGAGFSAEEPPNPADLQKGQSCGPAGPHPRPDL